MSCNKKFIVRTACFYRALLEFPSCNAKVSHECTLRCLSALLLFFLSCSVFLWLISSVLSLNGPLLYVYILVSVYFCSFSLRSMQNIFTFFVCEIMWQHCDLSFKTDVYVIEWYCKLVSLCTRNTYGNIWLIVHCSEAFENISEANEYEFVVIHHFRSHQMEGCR